ncbi:hypothetical protein [Actinomyces vulturis]|uniref:hypothetical protein n=1 Tax=Actinomyces vulturis TaxID=1857645 RepID=UPI00082DBA45|nr:hypothetical protein [Actinomyces vulturis]
MTATRTMAPVAQQTVTNHDVRPTQGCDDADLMTFAVAMSSIAIVVFALAVVGLIVQIPAIVIIAGFATALASLSGLFTVMNLCHR